MRYLTKVKTVTWWEFTRFYKLKNELIGIAVMVVLFTAGYFFGKLALDGLAEKQKIGLASNVSPQLEEILSKDFYVERISSSDSLTFVKTIEAEKEGMILADDGDNFIILAYRHSNRVEILQERLNTYRKQQGLTQIGISAEEYALVSKPADIETAYIFQPGKGRHPIVPFFFGGLMIMAVFVSFAYQFTAITGEKQLKITEQIVSAIGPQAWMDGKILGITLTGISSLLTYTILSILGALVFFQFTGTPLSRIGEFISIPAIGLFLVFTFMGVLMWNSVLAAIASIITDPNNSGKSSIMSLPGFFAATTLIIPSDPDGGLSVFLSFFPLTSASAMPMRWVSGNIEWWQLIVSFALLFLTFYLLRKLAAKIFRVAILITGKEPSMAEIFRLLKEK